MNMKRVMNATGSVRSALMQKMKYFFMVGIFLAFAAVASAQPSGDEGNPDEQVPFDGGVSLLVAAGVAYGAKKAYEAKNKNAASGNEESV